MRLKNRKKVTAILCVAAIFAGSILAPTEYNVQGKTKKPALNKKTLTLTVGKSSKVKVKNATGAKITWKLKKKTVTSIKKSGKYAVNVKAKKQGTTTLTAKVKKGKKSYTLSCKIKVQKPKNTDYSSDTPEEDTSLDPVTNETAAPMQSSPGTPNDGSGTTSPDDPSETSSTSSQNPPPAVKTPKPLVTSKLTISDKTKLSSACLDGNPTYNSDGSVTFTVTQQYGGGGLGFALDASKTALDLSDYSKVIFKVSADAEAPITLNAYTSSDFWNGRTDMASSTTSTEPKEITCNIPFGANLCGFGVKYNTYGYDASTLPEKLTITIHSISLVKDSRDITDATTNYSKLSELAASHGFKMGTVMNLTNSQNPKYRDLMKYHFNSVTAANEMKAYSMLNQNASKNAYTDETSMPVVNFTNADKIADYAQESGMKLRGHVLVWDADMCDWFFRVGYDSSDGVPYASPEVIKARLKNYMKQVMTHFEDKYPGLIYCWDVVNEAVGDSSSEYKAGDARHVRTLRSGKANLFYDTIGEDYVELSFQYAREILNDMKATKPNLDVKLYYNDYSTFYETKRDAICELVKSINSYQPDGNGGYVKLCDGVGMQSYIGGFGVQDGCMNEGDISLVKTAIQKFASLGVEVQVTELAVRNYVDNEETTNKHGEFYKKLFQAYLDVNSGSEKPLKAVSIWGIVDIPEYDPSEYGYRMNGPFCGLFDEDLQVKPAFVNIHDLMKK